MSKKCVAVIDSGVGGLSVLKRLTEALPNVDLVYFADNANLPYGNKGIVELRDIAADAVKKVSDRFDADLFVIACNTLTAAAIDELRGRFLNKTFVGCEPNLNEPLGFGFKDILVLCTAFTKNSRRINERFASRAEFLDMPELAELIENGESDEKITSYVADRAGKAAKRADCVSLGCTHYCLKEKLISDVLGLPTFSSVEGVARRAAALYREINGVEHVDGEKTRTIAFFSSGKRLDIGMIKGYM